MPSDTLFVVRAAILSIGTELVTGQTIDTNSAWLSAELTRLGVSVERHVTVGDELVPIRDAIRTAIDQSDLVVLTGGLGPTPDDLTRQGLAEAVGQLLVEDAGALGQIRDFFRRRERDMPESNRLQAMIPFGCEIIPNLRGTAPGIQYPHPHGALFAFPGVPGEMKPMFQDTVLPWVRSRIGAATTRSASLLCYGFSEALVGERLADLMARGRNPSVGTTASRTILAVRILARGNNADQAQRLLEADQAEIRKRLGDAVFGEGEETLQAAVARLLVATGATVATAESCTGGLLTKCLTDIPGSSEYFLRGCVAYSNDAKIELLGVPTTFIDAHGAVSEEVARAMAAGCRAAARSDLAISITGVAGPGGGTDEKPVGLVYIALAHAGGVEIRRQLFGETVSREEIRDRACKYALNLLRVHLLHSAEKPKTGVSTPP